MEDYITLMPYTEFNNLFRYGRLQLNAEHIQYVSCPFEEIRSHEDLFKAITHRVLDFEKLSEYVLVHYQAAYNYRLIIHPQQVLGVFALDEESEESLKARLDPRVVVNPSLWQEQFHKLQLEYMVKSCLRGVDNVFHIFGLDDSKKEEARKIISENIVRAAVDNALSGKPMEGLPCGEKSIWVYLLRYHRYAYYPEDNRGIVADAVTVLASYSKGKDMSSRLEGSPILNTLFDQPEENSVIDLNKYLLKVKGNENLKKLCLSIHQNFLDMATLYLKLARAFENDGIHLDQMIDNKPLDIFVGNLKNDEYIDTLSVASYLLGVFMSFEKTCDACYDFDKLRCFAPGNGIQKEPQVPEGVIESKVGQDVKKTKTKDKAQKGRKRVKRNTQPKKKSDTLTLFNQSQDTQKNEQQ